MYKFQTEHQITFMDFDQSCGMQMDPTNEWVRIADRIPWETLEQHYAELFPSPHRASCKAFPHGVLGLTVYPPEELPQNARAFLAVKYHAEEIKQQLISIGLREENIINVGKTLYDMGVRQYFDLPYLPHHDQEVFVDAGALNGDTSLRFMEWCRNKFEHIYCFEPDRTNIEKCQKNFEIGELCGGHRTYNRRIYHNSQSSLWPQRRNFI